MIHYALVCSKGHSFDGWFRSAADFDKQKEAKALSCPVCGTHAVDRAMMAPAIARGRERESVTTTPAGVPQKLAADPRASELIKMLRELRKAVMENAEYVGDRFAEEARRMHYGESEQRGIYGEATREEAEKLLEEGIEVHPLPVLPEDRN